MNETVLIIDDQEDLLEFLSEVFGEKYTVLTALNGVIALELLKKHLVHLVISDVMMPGIDGFELCERLKSDVDYCHIPIILLTAKNTFKSKIEGLENGADAYIEKPFSPELLQVQVANLLKNRSKIKDHAANAPFEDVRLTLQSKSDEQFLKKLDDYIAKNLGNNNLDIDQLAAYMNMSRPTFYRKIKSLCSVSAKELIDHARLKKAIELMAENNYKIFQIAKIVGYSSQSVFGKNFQKHFNQSPLEYIASLRDKSKFDDV